MMESALPSHLTSCPPLWEGIRAGSPRFQGSQQAQRRQETRLGQTTNSRAEPRAPGSFLSCHGLGSGAAPPGLSGGGARGRQRPLPRGRSLPHTPASRRRRPQNRLLPSSPAPPPARTQVRRQGVLTSEPLAEPLPSRADPVAALQQGHVLGHHVRGGDQLLHVACVQDGRLSELQLPQQGAENVLPAQGGPGARQGQGPQRPAQPQL